MLGEKGFIAVSNLGSYLMEYDGQHIDNFEYSSFLEEAHVFSPEPHELTKNEVVALSPDIVVCLNVERHIIVRLTGGDYE